MIQALRTKAGWALLLGALWLAGPGCSSAPEERAGPRKRVIQPGGGEAIATIGAISFDEMMRRGAEALESGRPRAASLYFGAALTARPSSEEAVKRMAEARFRLQRKGAPEALTTAERSLPTPPPEVLADVDALIDRWERESGVAREEPVTFFGEEEDREEAGGTMRDVLEEERRMGELPQVPGGIKGERPRIERPSLTTFIGRPSLMPCKPLRTGRNNLFHTLVHIPPFEGTRTLPSRVWEFTSGYDGAFGNLEEGTYGYGLFIRYDDNRYDEGFLKIAHGLSDDIEARIELTTGNLREGNYDIYITHFFDPYIRPYDRRADLGNLLLGLKTRLFRPFSDEPETGITSEVSFKVPVARNPKNFTTSGMPDLAVQITGAMDLFRFLRWPRLIPQGSMGLTIPFGEIFFDRDVDLDPVFFFGLGAVIQLDDHLALVAQVQGNTSAFGEFEPLSTLVLTSHVGARVLLGHFIVEGGFGHGFTRTSSTISFVLNVGFRFEGSDLVEEVVR